MCIFQERGFLPPLGGRKRLRTKGLLAAKSFGAPIANSEEMGCVAHLLLILVGSKANVSVFHQIAIVYVHLLPLCSKCGTLHFHIAKTALPKKCVGSDFVEQRYNIPAIVPTICQAYFANAHRFSPQKEGNNRQQNTRETQQVFSTSTNSSAT